MIMIAVIDYVALGSDFNGIVVVPFTVSEMSQLTHALIESGFINDQISKIMGQNIARLLSGYLPTGKQ